MCAALWCWFEPGLKPNSGHIWIEEMRQFVCVCRRTLQKLRLLNPRKEPLRSLLSAASISMLSSTWAWMSSLSCFTPVHAAGSCCSISYRCMEFETVRFVPRNSCRDCLLVLFDMRLKVGFIGIVNERTSLKLRILIPFGGAHAANSLVVSFDGIPRITMPHSPWKPLWLWKWSSFSCIVFLSK